MRGLERKISPKLGPLATRRIRTPRRRIAYALCTSAAFGVAAAALAWIWITR